MTVKNNSVCQLVMRPIMQKYVSLLELNQLPTTRGSELTAVLNTRKITTFIHFVAKYWMYVKRKKTMELELFTINKCKIIRKISYGISVILKILHHLLHTMIDFITQKFVFSQKFYEFDNFI